MKEFMQFKVPGVIRDFDSGLEHSAIMLDEGQVLLRGSNS
jgi:hypothetical protein